MIMIWEKLWSIFASSLARLYTFSGQVQIEEAATKLIFLAIRNFEKGGRNVRERVAARNQLVTIFAGRFDA
jgi:hypothetical protein